MLKWAYRPREAIADLLPDWAQPVFPGGLSRQSDGVWAPADFSWDLGEQVRVNEASHRRSGSGPDVERHFEFLLRAAVEATGLSLSGGGLVLDLASSDGAFSARPLLRMFPAAHVVATDPAGIPLATLVGRARAEGHSDRVLGVVAEPETVPARPGSIDLVCGVNVLHERHDPDLVLAAAARMLRPGGCAIFMAPFDGYGLLRIAYERIAVEQALHPTEPLGTAASVALQMLGSDIAVRTLPDPADPSFATRDQKWLFSRLSLEEAARGLGFSAVRFIAHNDHETLYRDIALVQLRSLAGPDAELPPWALAILDGFDRALRPPVKRLLMLDGTLVLTR
jgi:SAM-dependent methyltransferase